LATILPLRKASDHNALKLELNHKRKVRKNSNTWRLKSILLKNEWVNQEIKEELKKFMETNKNENTTVQTVHPKKAGVAIIIWTNSILNIGKNSNTWRLRSILLKNEWVNQEIKEVKKKITETNETENTTVQNL